MQIKTPTNQSSIFPKFFLGALLVLLGVFLYLHQDVVTRVKDFVSGGSSAQSVLSTIKKEIINSGKLIAQTNFADSKLTKSGVFTLTNAERTNAGLKNLSTNPKLDEIALIRAKDMFTNQYFEHVSPSGDSASKEAEVVTYEYVSLGENIALGNFKDDPALVLAWMNSPGHRANILNIKFTELGVAVVKGTYEGKQTWIAVQIFGKPLSDCPVSDSSLKASIEMNEGVVASNQAKLARDKAELETEASQTKMSQQEYNANVDAYNKLVQDTNDLIAHIKQDVGIYNDEVAQFNSCISK